MARLWTVSRFWGVKWRVPVIPVVPALTSTSRSRCCSRRSRSSRQVDPWVQGRLWWSNKTPAAKLGIFLLESDAQLTAQDDAVNITRITRLRIGSRILEMALI